MSPALILSFLLVGAAADMVVDASGEWPRLMQRLERAVLDERLSEIRAVRAECLRAATDPAREKDPLVRYAVAYADWRLVFNPAVPRTEQEALAEEAQQQLRAALERDPD